MPAPLIPWCPSNLPIEIQNELNRRKVNRSFRFVDNNVGWDPATKDWKNYKGPMSSWVRACSNGAGFPKAIKAGELGFPNGRQQHPRYTGKERFVLHGGKDFYSSYGYKPTKTGREQIIGYTPEGVPHTIDTSKTQNYPVGVPAPEITRIEVTVQKELYRRANIEWVCFSWEQLQYMTPYFLIPRITVMVEWGWNLFNPMSLVNIADRTLMRNLFKNPYPLYTDNIIKSNGNYDVIYGFITSFNWDVQGNKIVVTTEITSKDRLYAGIASDATLSSKADDKDGNETPGVLQSIKQFFSSNNTSTNIIGLSTSPASDINIFSATNTQAQPLYDIYQDLLSVRKKVREYDSDDVTEYYNLIDVQDAKTGYLSGIFCGRNTDKSKEILSPPASRDFDKEKKKDGENLWLNMGLVVELLNHFSKRQGVDDSSMFEVEIYYSVICGHPNLISCDPRVLIPNYKAPKYHYGLVGMYNATTMPEVSVALAEQAKEESVLFKLFSSAKTKDKNNEYVDQTVVSQSVSNPQDEKLYRVLIQKVNKLNVCYRNDLDRIININRYIATTRATSDLAASMYSFPAAFDKEFANGQKVEKDFSGLLSNIYIRYKELSEIITLGTAKTYVDIYHAIFQMLSAASDGLWDLALVENQMGKTTIIDRNYPAGANFVNQGEIYDFSYYDADSIIKSLKFRPQLSDAQATRAIYAPLNKNSKFSYSDRNDLLDYKFTDAIILPEDEKDSNTSGIDKENRLRAQLRDILRGIQVIDDTETFVMTTNATVKTVVVNPQGLVGAAKGGVASTTTQVPAGGEIVKLVMPSSAKPLLRMLLDDGDEERNPRYCAVQPGITLEMTLEGIGGLRTFQYFRIRNLPEPYSHRNIIFRVTDVVQTIRGGQWETTIKAGLLPLRKYIAKQLGITDVTFSNDGSSNKSSTTS